MDKIVCFPMLPTQIYKDSDRAIRSIVKAPSKWLVEPKIDGIRILCIVDKQYPKVVAVTRNGNVIDKFSKWFADHVSNLRHLSGLVIDGEVFVSNLRQTHSVIHGPTELKTVKKLTYYVFDVFPSKDCMHDVMTPLKTRKILLKEISRTFDKKHIVTLLGDYKLKGKTVDAVRESIFDLAEDYAKRGYEGIVIKHSESPYEHKRSRWWYKVKLFYSLDLRCIGVYDSDVRDDIIGGIIVDYCGKPQRVGSGFTLEERRLFKKNPKAIIGKIVEVRFFERTPSGALRFPVYVRIRYDKDVPDC